MSCMSIFFSMLANHWVRHQAMHKVSYQPGDCRQSLNLPGGACDYMWVNLITTKGRRHEENGELVRPLALQISARQRLTIFMIRQEIFSMGVNQPISKRWRSALKVTVLTVGLSCSVNGRNNQLATKMWSTKRLN